MAKRKRTQHGENQQQTLDQSFRLKKINPMTDTQSDVFDAYYENYNLFLYGCAGTGKSFISCYLALKDVLNPNTPYRKVYMVRSSVPSRDMGFMPGSKAEKMSVYEAPYVSMINDLFGRGDAYQVAQQKNSFEMLSTSFLRGVTFDNCIVIADEIQNFSFQELDTLITRVGTNCRLILCGDIEQCDLIRNKYDTTGLPQFMKILERMESFEFHEFIPEDIVRSGLVKEYILEKRRLDQLDRQATSGE
jgi:phosphate starvation-inducible PhoH-like protein